jgi:hypothetical protein
MAGCLRHTGPRRDQHGIPEILDLVDLQVDKMWEEQIQIQAPSLPRLPGNAEQ